METKIIEERKKNLSKKCKEIIINKISEFSILYPCWSNRYVIINTNLSKKIYGILPGEFITTPVCGNKLNLCVGMGISPGTGQGQDILYFLTEGNNELTSFFNGVMALISFKELEDYTKAIIV